MSATLHIYAPIPLAEPTCQLYDEQGELAQSVDLEPDTVPGRWVGSLTAAAGTYAAVIYDGEQLRGVFEQVVIPDQGVAVVRDTVNTSLQIDLEGLEVTAEVDETALGAAVWSHPERRLTMPATSIAPDLSGDVIKRRRGDTWTMDLTGLGELSNRHEVWFTAKRSLGDSDLDAILQITEASGLLRGDSADGSLVVLDPVAGNVRLAVGATTTRLLVPRSYLWDIQILRSDGQVQTLAEGRLVVVADVTRAIVAE